NLYLLKRNKQILGVVCLNEEQEAIYETVKWQYTDASVLVVHRLVITPAVQGQGFGNKLMAFVEQYAIKNGYTAIRLDSYTKNQGAFNLYEKRGYHIRGEVYFPGREDAFFCMEKRLVL
ncbi:MAG: GNAT family N-acetyltransferase, partial [Bacteroidota bacterium]